MTNIAASSDSGAKPANGPQRGAEREERKKVKRNVRGKNR